MGGEKWLKPNFLMLDFEKKINRIEWDFLFSVLKYGFSLNGWNGFLPCTGTAPLKLRSMGK